MRTVVVFHTAANGAPSPEDLYVRVQYDDYHDPHAPAHCLDVELDVEIVPGHHLEALKADDEEAEITGIHGGEHVWLHDANPLPAPITAAIQAIVAGEGLALQSSRCAVLKPH